LPGVRLLLKTLQENMNPQAEKGNHQEKLELTAQSSFYFEKN